MKILWKQFIGYYKSHIWLSLATIVVSLSFAFLIILQLYMKTQYMNYLTDKTIEAETAIMKSVAKNIEFVLGDLINIGCKAATDTTLYNIAKQINDRGSKPELTLKMENELNNYAHHSEWIVGMCVSVEGTPLYQYDKMQSSAKLWETKDDQILMDSFKKMEHLLESNKVPKLVVSTDSSKVYPNKHIQGMIHISFPILQPNTNGYQTMLLTMTINTAVLEMFLNEIYQSYEDIATGYLVDESGKIVYHNEQQVIGHNREEYLKTRQSLSMQMSLDKLDWLINIDINEKQLLKKVNAIYYRGSAIFMLTVITILLLSFFVIRAKILSPIKLIIGAIDDAGNKREHHPIYITGTNEVWQIAKQFNKMMASLEESSIQIENQYQEKVTALKKQRNAEREALESQINAHFICNTINVINYEAIDAGNHKVSILLKKLSNILRYSFDQRHQDVYIYQELAWIEQYLYLQKTRFEEVFDYEIDFPEELQDNPCRKLMFQPFVENSIIHGFEGRTSGGLIKIEGRAYKEKYLKMTIEDNGVGMNDDIEKKVRWLLKNPYERNMEGIGIANVIARIHSAYGKDTKIELETSREKGCKFIFILPLLREEERVV